MSHQIDLVAESTSLTMAEVEDNEWVYLLDDTAAPAPEDDSSSAPAPPAAAEDETAPELLDLYAEGYDSSDTESDVYSDYSNEDRLERSHESDDIEGGGLDDEVSVTDSWKEVIDEFVGLALDETTDLIKKLMSDEFAADEPVVDETTDLIKKLMSDEFAADEPVFDSIYDYGYYDGGSSCGYGGGRSYNGLGGGYGYGYGYGGSSSLPGDVCYGLGGGYGYGGSSLLPGDVYGGSSLLPGDVYYGLGRGYGYGGSSLLPGDVYYGSDLGLGLGLGGGAPLCVPPLPTPFDFGLDGTHLGGQHTPEQRSPDLYATEPPPSAAMADDSQRPGFAWLPLATPEQQLPCTMGPAAGPLDLDRSKEQSEIEAFYDCIRGSSDGGSGPVLGPQL